MQCGTPPFMQVYAEAQAYPLCCAVWHAAQAGLSQGHDTFYEFSLLS